MGRGSIEAADGGIGWQRDGENAGNIGGSRGIREI